MLVWQDMAGPTSGKTAKFVKRFGDVGGELHRAATQYADEVASSTFPDDEHKLQAPGLAAAGTWNALEHVRQRRQRLALSRS